MNRHDIDVLLIDDEPSVLAMLSACLVHAGFTFRRAENGRAALPLLTQHRFGLIVTDIHMPDMDGLEVIMHCTATIPGVQILAMSGGGRYDVPGGALKPARLLGSRRTLAKPFTGTEFLETVRAMLRLNEYA